MNQFLYDIFEYRFLQYSLITTILASVACGFVGSFVVVRRSTYITGAISHSLLAGMGLALFLNRVHGFTWLTPLQGAVSAAIIVAIIITCVRASGKERMDTVLSVIWSVGMALGVTLISATPGYNEDLMSYLFGNILMVSSSDLIVMALLDVIIIISIWMFYYKFLTISFHRELADLRGIRVNYYEFLFLILTALTIVLLVNVVGIVLVIALLTLPAAAAAHFTKRLSTMIILAILLTFVFTIGGLVISYAHDWPVGPTIIELAGLTYLLILFVKRVMRTISSSRFR
ncbi:metal ABC transporter permease [bacterium]|nr:metal ABC transporter permease [bacterium]